MKHGVLLSRVLVAFLLLNGVVATTVWRSVQRSRQEHEMRARDRADNLSLLLADSIDSMFDKADLGVLAAKDEIELLAAHALTTRADIGDFLAHQAGRVPVLDAFRFAGADGTILYGQGIEKGSNVSIANREYFIQLRDNPRAGRVFSHPMLGRVNHQWSIFIARRCDRPDGSFFGVVYGVMFLDRFTDMFARLSLGSKGVIALRGLDAALVARYPPLPVVGSRAVSPHFQEAMGRNPDHGDFVGPAGTDSVVRRYSYRRTLTYPGYVVAGLAADDYLADWRREAANSALVVAGFFAGTLVLGGLVWRDWNTQAAAAEKMAELARTDALTGLANRRAFLEAAGKEFLRGRRFGSTAALLMIDVDRFKRVNDAYGHEAGDRALAALAATMKAMARATDLPARFGGEEFVFLLVGARLAGAMELAERIRAAVAQVRVPGPTGEFGFTVSVGAASFREEDSEWSQALRRADQAMYQAKEAGRDRVATLES